jgi:5-methylcytosine-specific restriction endonuclease McrA
MTSTPKSTAITRDFRPTGTGYTVNGARVVPGVMTVRRGEAVIEEYVECGTITASRPAPKVRAKWPVERQAREDAAWEDLVRIDAQCCDVYPNDGWTTWGTWEKDKRQALERLRYERHLAIERYRHAAQWESDQVQRQRRGRILPQVRRMLLAEWEAAGRICSICLAPVPPGAPVHIDHITPIDVGGGNDLANLRIVHATCNLSRERLTPWPYTQEEPVPASWHLPEGWRKQVRLTATGKVARVPPRYLSPTGELCSKDHMMLLRLRYAYAKREEEQPDD